MLLHDLNFKPKCKSGSWSPTFAWGDLQLTNFDKEILADQVVDLKLIAPEFLTAFTFCYPKVQILELVRLRSCFVESKTSNLAELLNMNFDSQDEPFADSVLRELLSRWGYQARQEHLQLLGVLKSFPQTFLAWVEDKELWFNDLMILTEVENPSLLQKLCDFISMAQPSKSHGTQIIELFCELVLKGNSEELNDVFSNTNSLNKKSIENVIFKLKAKRNPLTSSSDEIKKQKLLKLDLPTGVSASLQRNGDKAVVNLQISIQSRSDVEKHISYLEKSKATLQELM